MRIYTDPRTGMKYADYTLKGKRVRESLHTKSQNVAILKAGKIITDESVRDNPKALFAPFWERYLVHAKTTLREASYTNIQDMKQKLDKFGSPKYITEITVEYADRFKVWLVEKQGLAKSSANTIMGYFKAMVSQAETWGLINISLRKVKPYKVNTERVEFHSVEELRQLLKTAPNFEWEVLVHLDARTGLREAELGRLKWKDIDIKNDDWADVYVNGESKTYKFRIVPVRSAHLIQKLKRLKESKKAKENDLVFSGIANGADFGSYYFWWANARNPFHCFLHKLRHTFASHLAQQDTPLQKIAKLCGHASIQTTMRYAHLMPSDLSESVANLEEI